MTSRHRISKNQIPIKFKIKIIYNIYFDQLSGFFGGEGQGETMESLLFLLFPLLSILNKQFFGRAMAM